MSESLTLRVAKIIDDVGFACTPEMYGLKTEEELSRTLAGAARSVAMDKAREVIRMVKSDGRRKR
jgi:hypothetical protein